MSKSYPSPQMPNMPEHHIAVGQVIDNHAGASSDVPTAEAFVIPSTPTVQTFEVPLPNGAGPGTSFLFHVHGRQHQMVVPDGARQGQVLRCMLVPRGAFPGAEVVVITPEGEMAVTIPDGMAPGEVLVVDLGTELRQWTGSEDDGRCCSWTNCFSSAYETCCDSCSRWMPFLVCFGLLLSFIILVSSSGHHRPYGYGYGGGYYAQPVNPAVNEYKQHLLSHSNIAYGAVPSPPAMPIDPKLANEYPGKDEGFERGVDDKGNEIYKYTCTAQATEMCTQAQLNPGQAYIVPANDYYAWRSEYHHGALNHELLHMLLLTTMFHAMMYRPGMYFGRPMMPFYRSGAYMSHYGSPMRGVGGAVSYPRGGAMGGAGGYGAGGMAGRAGTPVAQARPMGGAAGGYKGGSTPVAQARPTGGAAGGYRPSGGGYSGGRSYSGGSRGRG